MAYLPYMVLPAMYFIKIVNQVNISNKIFVWMIGETSCEVVTSDNVRTVK